MANTINMLHVEDDGQFAELVETYLHRELTDISIQHAANPEEGDEILVEYPINCIVSDYDMPEINGIEFLESVRATHEDLPFILFTGKGSEEVAGEAISKGVTDYLQKNGGTSQYTVLANRIRNSVERYEAQTKLVERETRLNLFFEQSPLGVIEWDEDFLCTRMNDSAEEILGYTEDELTGQSWETIVPESDRDDVTEVVSDLLENKGGYHSINENVGKDGSLIICEWHNRVVTDNDDDVVGIFSQFRDITEGHTREQALQDLYKIISDSDRSFSEKVNALLDLGRETLEIQYGTLSKIEGEDYLFEFVSTDDDSIAAGDEAPVSATNCEIAATQEETIVLGDVERDAPEETHRAGFTEWGISCYVGTPVFKGDDVYGTFCFYDTEARADQFDDWEVTLVDLMGKWVSTELTQQGITEELERKNEQLERFTSVVSHDLRNPLNVASGRLELAQDDCDSEHLEDIDHALDRMETLIEDLLELARHGESVGEHKPIEINGLLETCWANVETPDATLNIDIEETINADRTRLRQVFENLFRNAVEHGGEDVTVTVAAVDNGIYIEDDGLGIPESDYGDIFKAGYSTGDDGTGFGLSIVSEIVEAHGWKLTVTDGSDGGARFEITDVEFV